MRAFRKSISARMLATVLGLSLVGALMVVAAVLTMDGLRTRAESLQASALQAVYAERVNRLVAMVVMDSRGIYASRDNAELRYFADGLIRHLDGIDATMTARLAIASPLQRPRVDALAAVLQDFSALRRELVAIADQKGPDAARELGESNRTDRIKLNEALAAAAIHFGEQDVNRAMDQNSDYGKRRVGLLLAISAIGLLAAMIAAWVVVSRSMLRPLTSLKTCVDRMAKGDLQIPVGETARGDEIGTIARSVENFRQSLLQIRDIEAREHDSDMQRVARAERIQKATGHFEQAIRDCMADVHRSITQVAEVAEALSLLVTSSTQEAEALAGSAHDASANAQARLEQEVSTLLKEIAAA